VEDRIPLDTTCNNCGHSNLPPSDPPAGPVRLLTQSNGHPPARILIASNRPGERAGVSAALRTAGFLVCGEAASAEEAVAAARQGDADVCLIDVELPGGGIVAAAKISTGSSTPAVIMLAAEPREDDLFDALRAGAAGFLPLDIKSDRLARAIAGVLNGEAAVSRTLVARVIAEFRAQPNRRRLVVEDRRGIELTSREWEVLDLMRQHLSTKQISARLGVSQVTVRRHIGSILHKLGVESRGAALTLLDS
jgi:two-component system, NarL family, nitrate/nitrite response regulator NarL